VTEHEWDGHVDPDPMLEFLRGTASPRKLRLAACAGARRVWHHLRDARSRRAVVVVERFADGEATAEELDAARHGAGIAEYDVGMTTPSPADEDAELAEEFAVRAPTAAASTDADLAAAHGWPSHAASAAYWEAAGAGGAYDAAQANEYKAQTALIRDVFGNSFRPPPRIDPAWLAWRGGAVVQLARAVYEERDLASGHLDAARLAILADMLEEAGATNPQLLGHLRSAGPHVRGCAAVDALLGKC
jgi:hypothetical protein